MCLRFFSSRRRHTRYSSDWSSDVCSSDLVSEEGPLLASKTPGKLRSEACEEGKMRKRRPWVFVLGILMLLSGSTFGQVATTGKIAGMVTDSSGDRKSTRLNSSHGYISYAVFCLKKKKKTT